MKLSLFLTLMLCAGCATKRECNLDRISMVHHDLEGALEDHQALIMDMMQTIGRLEGEAGGYH